MWHKPFIIPGTTNIIPILTLTPSSFHPSFDKMVWPSQPLGNIHSIPILHRVCVHASPTRTAAISTSSRWDGESGGITLSKRRDNRQNAVFRPGIIDTVNERLQFHGLVRILYLLLPNMQHAIQIRKVWMAYQQKDPIPSVLSNGLVHHDTISNRNWTDTWAAD